MRAAALLLVVAAAAAGGGNGSCDQRCGAMELPYPFGFSGGCAIQLGCDDGVGSAWLGATRDLGLLVRNVTRRALILALRPDCSRPFNASVAALFSDSYAPASGNTLVVSSCSRGSSDAAHLRNCSSEPPDRYMNKTSSRCGTNESIRCILPLPPSNASGVHPRTNASIRGHHFLTKSEVLRSNCAGLVSAVSYSDAQGPSLLLGALELDWWVPGLCRCAHGADCTRFTAPTTGREAFRCECREGFEGDGFVDGAGCRKVSKCDPSKYPSGVCGKNVLVGLLMAGIIFGAMVMGLSCVVCHLLKRRSASIRSQQSTKRLLSAADCTVPLYSYREIERATSGFSEDQRLGTGAYGTVYAGRLSDNRLVAVKRIKHRGDTAADGLGCVMNEVKLVSSVSHRNLVRLLGCCIDQGHQILVYEFMPNGTLAQHLQRERGRAAVPWTVRLRIAAETAKAVAYLHSEVHPPIYHRDIKSSNILLDHDYNSKVADFGLSRMGMASDVDSSHISTAPQGTPGYVDPQYHQNFHLSDKSDVYSFGVVLVEIITAMRVVDFSRAPNEINLAQLAVEKIGRGCVDEIVDPFLDPHRDAWTLTSIHKVAELAFRCLAFHSEIRPSMAEVADELEQIQVSGWAPSTDDAAFMSTTSSLCSSSAPSRGPDKSRGEALSSTPVIAVVAQETEKGAVGSSPVSVHERWFSDRSSPSSSSLLANSSSLH